MNYTNKISEIAQKLPWISNERIHHVISTADTAVKLAELYAPALVEKAYVAGLYHDCAKGLEQKLINKYDVSDFKGFKPTLHAPLGAYFARDNFGIDDQDVLSAIYWHCTGRPNMNDLEKIIFISDAIEPLRCYYGVELLRDITMQDLDKGVFAYLKNLLSHLESQNAAINPHTLRCYEFYRNLYDKNISK
jgi:predicted HD superfamily hydrolase involved in NAD metabolism